jgi:hypothetical protein
MEAKKELLSVGIEDLNFHFNKNKVVGSEGEGGVGGGCGVSEGDQELEVLGVLSLRREVFQLGIAKRAFRVCAFRDFVGGVTFCCAGKYDGKFQSSKRLIRTVGIQWTWSPLRN